MSSESENKASNASTTNSNQTNDGQPGDTSEEDKIINEITSDIFHDIILELCIEVHRSLKLGYFYLFERDIEKNEDVPMKDGCDIFDTSQRDVEKLTCVCERCQKKVKGCQYIAHLLACRKILKKSGQSTVGNTCQSGLKTTFKASVKRSVNKRGTSTSNSNQTDDGPPGYTSEGDKIINDIGSNSNQIDDGQTGCTSEEDKIINEIGSNINQTDDGQASCTSEEDKIINEISSDIFHDIILELCFEVHRSLKLGYFHLFQWDIETNEDVAVKDGSDIFGTSLRDVKKLTCICERCKKKVNGSRYTAHLLGCRGLLKRSNLRNAPQSEVKTTFQSSIKRSVKKRGLQ